MKFITSLAKALKSWKVGNPKSRYPKWRYPQQFVKNARIISMVQKDWGQKNNRPYQKIMENLKRYFQSLWSQQRQAPHELNFAEVNF